MPHTKSRLELVNALSRTTVVDCQYCVDPGKGQVTAMMVTVCKMVTWDEIVRDNIVQMHLFLFLKSMSDMELPISITL